MTSEPFLLALGISNSVLTKSEHSLPLATATGSGIRWLSHWVNEICSESGGGGVSNSLLGNVFLLLREKQRMNPPLSPDISSLGCKPWDNYSDISLHP